LRDNAYVVARNGYHMTISVAMINYNNERYIRKALDSIFSQTRLPDEVVISDDGSTDASLEIIQEFAERFGIIKLFKTPKNLGPSGNRNAAIRNCTSKFVINIDSDDWFEPNVIACTYEMLNDAPNSIVISSFSVCPDESNVYTTIDTAYFCSLSQKDMIFYLASRQRNMPGNQMAFSMNTYQKIGGLNPDLRLYEDWDFMLRSLLHGVEWKHTGMVGYSYRKSGQGVSSARQWRHHKYRCMIMFRSLLRGPWRFLLLRGYLNLFILKGWKYLRGTQSAIGYN